MPSGKSRSELPDWGRGIPTCLAAMYRGTTRTRIDVCPDDASSPFAYAREAMNPRKAIQDDGLVAASAGLKLHPLPIATSSRGRLPEVDSGEAFLAFRRNACIDAHELLDLPGLAKRCGRLYVTTRRLVHVAREGTLAIELEEIDEAILLTADRQQSGILLLTMRCGRGLILVAEKAADLRTRIATARSRLTAPHITER
jgi:hypothetical protein